MSPRAELPRIAVSMPAYNVAPFIAEAIESVLAQEGVTVEIVVVDDASTDATAAVAGRYAERGVRIIRNSTNRGISYNHNLVLRETTAPVIAHVDSDDRLLPGALAKLAAAVLSDPTVGQAYCDFYPIDVDGTVAPGTIERWRAFYARQRSAPIDYARELIVHGMVVNHLRTYRREVFDTLGGFDERETWSGDYEMALRLAERFQFAHVPEMLYERREHATSITGVLRRKNWQYWQNRWSLVRRRLRAQHGRVLGHGAASAHALLLLGLGYVARAAITSQRTDS
jgi:glycosyltransferase involved in cell wall biosynthesis